MRNHAVPVTAFKPGSGFLPKLSGLVKDVVIPYQYKILNDEIPGVEKSHALENLRLAAEKLKGGAVNENFYGMVFQDSDVAKWLEAAAFTLVQSENPEIEAEVESVIDLLAAAQHKDGYLNSYFTVKEPDRRWSNLQEAHELYCAGHLIEAACAHYEATGSDKLLKIMENNADCIYDHFMNSCKDGYCGHPEIELALMKLYKASGNEKYKELALHFVNVRGKCPHYFIEEKKSRGWEIWGSDAEDTDYTQSTVPVREQKDAVGHAVRAVYLYTAMADLAAESGDESLREACESLWESITRRRMYVTGGIGSTVIGEAFTVDYDLPNSTVYAETCASIGLIFFARRMLELEPKGEYGDVMERALYNTVLAGMQLDGKRFFYVNPLESVPGISGEAATQKHVLPQRPSWYSCACCPPNVARLLSSIGCYAYSTGENTLFTHLYIGGSVDSGMDYSLSCETGYPHCGKIHYEFLGSKETTLAFRIPEWSVNTVILINGEKTEPDIRDGYAYLTRLFSNGDTIELSLDMTPRKVYASPLVPADTGYAAVQRGPLVYCAEGADNNGDVLSLSLDREGSLKEEKCDLLDGAAVINAEGWRTLGFDGLYTSRRPEREKTEIKMIPYYAWGNRGLGQMRVWLPEG